MFGEFPVLFVCSDDGNCFGLQAFAFVRRGMVFMPVGVVVLCEYTLIWACK